MPPEPRVVILGAGPAGVGAAWRLRALGLIGLFLAWQVFGSLFSKIFFPAVSLLYPGVNYQ